MGVDKADAEEDVKMVSKATLLLLVVGAGGKQGEFGENLGKSDTIPLVAVVRA